MVLALAGNALRATEPQRPTALGLAGIGAHGDSSACVDETLDPEFLAALRARETLYRTCGPDSEAPVWVFLGYFDRQKEGSQVHSPRHCYPGSGWNIEAEPRWPAPWGGGEVHSLVVDDGVERRLVLYWYQLETRTESDVLPLKIELTRRAILRGSQDVVFASLSTPTGPALAEAMGRLAPYARDIHLEIDRLYRERDESHARAW